MSCASVRVARLDFPPASFEAVPPAVGTLGPLARELCVSAGLVLDPWQAYALDCILAEKADGSPAAFEVGLILPRQNGKGAILEALSLAWLFLTDIPLILHSAHEFKTAEEAFRRLRLLINNSPKLSSRVQRIRMAAGQESIELKSGQRLRYLARSKGSGRGFTGGKVILDEAYALEAPEMAALLPTMATQRQAQVIYTSSAGMVASTHLRNIRNRGRSNKPGSLCYLEWGGIGECVEGCTHRIDNPECALNDEELWVRANPGIPRRIPLDFVANERATLDPGSFARERLGWWDEDPTVRELPIPVDIWATCKDEASQIVGPVIMAVDVSPQSRKASIAVAGQRADGIPHGELVDSRNGTGWIIERLQELIRRHPLRRIKIGEDDWRPGVVLDPAGPAGGMLRDMQAVGIDPVLMTSRDMGQACAWLETSVREHAIRHIGQAQIETALLGAMPRPIGDGMWAWGRVRSGMQLVDISPLVAVTAAFWGLSAAEARQEQQFFAAWR